MCMYNVIIMGIREMINFLCGKTVYNKNKKKSGIEKVKKKRIAHFNLKKTHNASISHEINSIAL